MAQDELVSARMAARLINMTPSTMQGLLKQGKIEAEIIGGYKKVRLTVLSRFSGATMGMLEERLGVFKAEIAENMHNRETKGNSKNRAVVDRKYAQSKITPAIRQDVKTRYTGKHGEQTALAKEFGLSTTAIWKIIHDVPNAK